MILFSQIDHSEQNTGYEGFLSQIYTDFISSDYEYYYLKKEAYPIDDFTVEVAEEANLDVPIANFNDLKKKILNAVNVKYDWKLDIIEKARVCNKDSLRIAPIDLNPVNYIFVDSMVKNNNRALKHYTFLVTVKKRWGLKKKFKEGEKQFKAYKDNYRGEDYQCFSFSIPVFFNNEKNALIIFKTDSQSIYRIYYKEQDKWKKETDIFRFYRHRG